MNLSQANRLPVDLHRQVTGIAEAASHAAFTTIHACLSNHGYPCTGDMMPGEALAIDEAFESFVRAVALNNPTIARLQEDGEFLLDQTSPALINELGDACGDALGLDYALHTYVEHTGGGCMVAVVDLSQDGRGIGRQLWLTREDEREWLIGIYDFGADPEDEGTCFAIRGFDVPLNSQPWLDNSRRTNSADDPVWVAGQVADILRKLGARLAG